MAPGCFAPSAKESSAPKPVTDSSQDTQLVAECLANNSSEPIINQIPLPLSPPPPLSRSDDEDDDDDDSDDDEDDSDVENDDDTSKKEGNLLQKNQPRLNVPRRNHYLIFDTVDTFEILEQTIIKQKRLAKLKNTDLRRKVLLKRTFDLVLEIMDAENGFNDDEPASPSPAPPAVELQLHPETMRMDDGEDEDEEPIVSTTTLVKLVDVGPPEETSARVPRQIKRRCSFDDDDQENDADDENEDDKEGQLDEAYFYEYSMNHLNDQQLNYRTSVHSLDHPSDLKIYADSLVDVHKHRPKTDESSSRSNHARKRMRHF